MGSHHEVQALCSHPPWHASISSSVTWVHGKNLISYNSVTRAHVILTPCMPPPYKKASILLSRAPHTLATWSCPHTHPLFHTSTLGPPIHTPLVSLTHTHPRSHTGIYIYIYVYANTHTLYSMLFAPTQPIPSPLIPTQPQPSPRSPSPSSPIPTPRLSTGSDYCSHHAQPISG